MPAMKSAPKVDMRVQNREPAPCSYHESTGVQAPEICPQQPTRAGQQASTGDSSARNRHLWAHMETWCPALPAGALCVEPGPSRSASFSRCHGAQNLA